jgi:hypothetical protein
MDANKRLDTKSLVHLNNFIFLVFSLCTDWVYDHDYECHDSSVEGLLYFVLYGNLIVYAMYICNPIGMESYLEFRCCMH